MTYYFIDDFDNICRQKEGMDKDFAEVIDLIELINDTNKIQEENEQLKSFIKKLTNHNGEILLMNGYGYTKSYVERLLE